MKIRHRKWDGRGKELGGKGSGRLVLFFFKQKTACEVGVHLVGSEMCRRQPGSVIREGKSVGQLGIQLSSSVTYPESLVTEIDYGPISAIPRAIEEVVENCIFVVKSVGKLVTGNLSPKNLSGPITIAKVAGDTARAGFDNFIRFVAILSIMLGVMNLMPVPVLDGGHIVFILIEVMKGSPVSERIQLVGYKAGFAMLISLMIFATFNDLMRPF